MTSQDIRQYSKGSKFLHWLIALLVIVMLSGGFFLEDLPASFIGPAFMLHKSFGITIFFLMLLRLVWILHTGKPALPVSVLPWQRMLSRFVQYALYFFVIVMPLSGWIMSTAANKPPYFFNLFQLPLPGFAVNKNLASLMKETHNILAWIIIVLLILHIAGAVKHHFIDKDEVLRRILPKRG